jgi:tripartite-type tricarboxylate transporter receptor subunit TctC
MGPAGIPQPIVDKLGAIIREATKTPEFKSNITNAGFEPFDGSAADLKALVGAELIRWEKTAQDAGITPE